MLNSRRAAREMAVLILYAQQTSGLPLSEVMDRTWELIRRIELELEPEEQLDPGELNRDSVYGRFMRELVLKTIRDTDVIDQIIAERAHKWDLERIARLDRIIMRVGIAEMLHFPDIPDKVSINEAIEIGKKYSTDNSGKFINGILDSVKSLIPDLRKRYDEE